jgi:hypothetical protein
MCFIIDIAVLDELLKSGKDVFIYYGRGKQNNWTTMLTNECPNGGKNSLKEMEGLRTFLDDHKGLAGVIIAGLQYQVKIDLI